MEVEVYKSRRRPDTYLLVQAEEGLSRVPEELTIHFGEAELSFRFTLTEERRLARIDPVELRSRLVQTGYWLQIPPPQELNG